MLSQSTRLNTACHQRDEKMAACVIGLKVMQMRDFFLFFSHNLTCNFCSKMFKNVKKNIHTFLRIVSRCWKWDVSSENRTHPIFRGHTDKYMSHRFGVTSESVMRPNFRSCDTVCKTKASSTIFSTSNNLETIHPRPIVTMEGE